MVAPPPLLVSAPSAGAAASSARPAGSSLQQMQRQGPCDGGRQRRVEAVRLRRVFDLFDRDGDGVITPTELSGALGRLGLALDNGVPAQDNKAPAGTCALEAVVAAYVAPGMPGLRFQDFEALHAELAGDHGHGKEEEEMREAFSVFDEDGDGYISATELQAVLARMGLPEAGCMARVRDMITAADQDSDGRVDFDEFKAMMGGPSAGGIATDI
ncbi:putative calcium-binding protein CML21 [Dichanthelium oligosanthes]|uniref:Putative calcium-binding protein CML21 n=1 Tax=Dichanthelium oligosanthes TaxID=888268 RepID=A0A1E5V8A5_9POAL|nr:putative calcium-binding protein CML21 [Dichanthelium oligosanthes]